MSAQLQLKERPASNVHFHDAQPEQGDARGELLAGLEKDQKTVNPKWFYDAAGSDLFEQITQVQAVKFASGDNRLRLRTVHDLPALSIWCRIRQVLSKHICEVSAPPNARVCQAETDASSPVQEA